MISRRSKKCSVPYLCPLRQRWRRHRHQERLYVASQSRLAWSRVLMVQMCCDRACCSRCSRRAWAQASERVIDSSSQ